MKTFYYFKITSFEELKIICMAISIILIIPPSFIWGYNNINFLSLSLMLIALVIQLTHQRKITIKPYIFFYLLYHIYIHFVDFNKSEGVFSTHFILTFSLFLFNKETLFKVFKVFCNILGLLLLVSLIFYLFNILDIYNPSYKSFTYNNREYELYYFNTMLTVFKRTPIFLATGFYRFQAFFDEPGFLGTMSSLILCVFKFDFKKNKILYVFLISSLLSMSLASYITLFVGLIFILNIRTAMQISVPFILIGFLNFQLIDNFILSRLKVDQGATRTTQVFDSEWNDFLSTSDIFIGRGIGEHTLFGGGVSSWKTIVYNSGLIGLTLYTLILLSILLSFYNGNRYCIVIFLLFIITIYHRPDVLTVYYLLIYLGGLIKCRFEIDTSLANRNPF